MGKVASKWVGLFDDTSVARMAATGSS